MANIIVNIAHGSEAQYQQLLKNGANPVIVEVEDNEDVIVFRSNWKWTPCPSIIPFHSLDIDAYPIKPGSIIERYIKGTLPNQRTSNP